MKVAIVLQTTRNSDPSVFAFTDPDKAIQFAKGRLKDSDGLRSATEVLNERMVAAGWLYYAWMEGVGSVRVEVLDVQE